MANMTKTQYDGAVGEIRSLLENWLETGIDLFLKLKEVDDSGVWKLPGHATFGDFLRSEFPTALGIERYQNVINAINVYGVDWVRKVGVHSCHALTVKGLVENPDRRQVVVKAVDRFIETNHCAPDYNKVRDIVRDVAPETKKPGKELRELSEVEQLRSENKDLRAENRELRSQLRKLERENEKLRSTGASKKSTAKDGSAKNAASRRGKAA